MQDGCGIAFLYMERNLDIMQLWKKLCTLLTSGMLALSVSPAAISAVPEICAAAAENTSTYGKLKYTLTSDRAIITSCEKSAVSVTIPEEIEGKPVLQIAENAFYSRTELTDVTIPDTVRALGSRAFYGCSKLNHVQLPKYLLTIGSGCFMSCASLSEITIPGTVRNIGNSVFFQTPWLEERQAEDPLVQVNHIVIDGEKCTDETLVIPEGVTLFPNDLCKGCKNLTSVTIPGTVKWIEDYNFSECTALTSVVIPEGVEQIDYNAFSGCSALETVWIPLSMQLINMRAFSDCTSLKTVEYAGSQDDWDRVGYYEDGNEQFLDAEIHFANLLTADKFADVSHDWAYDGINYCYTHRLMRGIDGERFAPKATTTRAQIVQILYNLQGEPEVSGPMPFDDVFNHWAEKPILWAYQTGVVAGTSDTTFDPDKPVTREQIAVILMGYVDRILKLEHTWEPADLSGYPDAGSVSGWAKDALADAVALGLISGASNGGQTYLDPQGGASREQVATILMEFCKNVMNKQ